LIDVIHKGIFSHDVLIDESAGCFQRNSDKKSNMKINDKGCLMAEKSVTRSGKDVHEEGQFS
jgi:hypothetical protein